MTQRGAASTHAQFYQPREVCTAQVLDTLSHAGVQTLQFYPYHLFGWLVFSFLR